MAETWHKHRTHVDPGIDAWEVCEGGITVGIIYNEADADAIVAAHNADAALVEALRADVQLIVNHLGPVVPAGLPDGADIEWAESLAAANRLLANLTPGEPAREQEGE